MIQVVWTANMVSLPQVKKVQCAGCFLYFEETSLWQMPGALVCRACYRSHASGAGRGIVAA